MSRTDLRFNKFKVCRNLFVFKINNYIIKNCRKESLKKSFLFLKKTNKKKKNIKDLIPILKKD